MSARDRRDQRNEAPGAARSAKQHAFEQGKRALTSGQASSANPYRNSDLWDAWQRGFRYAANLRSGLRPLDTARRVP